MANIIDAVKLITDAGADARIRLLKSRKIDRYSIMVMLGEVAILETFARPDGSVHPDAIRDFAIDLADPKTWSSSGVTMPSPEPV